MPTALHLRHSPVRRFCSCLTEGFQGLASLECVKVSWAQTQLCGKVKAHVSQNSEGAELLCPTPLLSISLSLRVSSIQKDVENSYERSVTVEVEL